ncbi:DUF1800 domain-containing protein [Winogradskyella sp.]|jgi:uncharacterized protein (DUF1800 family)|uniref:DUF1800 domain-containing protein n=1 Tax=Winogradskyella sp. TaxID=1883156 RepID=UPI0025FA3E31|nr:DUF1800 domain-containing protein [Winogradskyella sp.]MCT4628333.1 DUF1800 domain-containing protein [Winogradskyella sp.]
MNQKEIQHLYWRAGFGINPILLSNTSLSRKKVVDVLFRNAEPITPLYIDLSYLDGINPSDLKKYPSLEKEIRDKSSKSILELNYAWVNRLINPTELLRERMTLFWANHFVCRDRNPLHMLQYNNTLRDYALGDFRDFVKAISKETSMLKYLNGKQNRKRHPNENFARELMELFTLGEGKYSEKDIKESARAFTGYNHNFYGEFVFRENQHDDGFKTFFGETARYNGDDIIDKILERRECAQYVSSKIYRYFVNPVPNNTHIEAMTEVFYKDYNIEKLMRFVFLSDWFYNDKNIGAKIKSPIELLVGIANTVPVKFEREKDLLVIQRILGQSLLNPPNVAGWKGDKAWIDANTIMVRLKLPSVLLNNALISLKEYGDFNDKFRKQYFKRTKGKLPFKVLPNWDVFSKNFDSIATENLTDIIIQGTINKGTASFLNTLSKASKRDYCVQLMSLPEYQMC